MASSECVAPVRGWRKQAETWSDENAEHYLHWSWVKERDTSRGPPYNGTYHDWTQLRALALREARRRGLDISCTGLGT